MSAAAVPSKEWHKHYFVLYDFLIDIIWIKKPPPNIWDAQILQLSAKSGAKVAVMLFYWVNICVKLILSLTGKRKLNLCLIGG